MNVNVRIRGLSPLLQHRFTDAAGDDSTRAADRYNAPPRDQAELVCYRDGGRQCYFPGQAIARLLREAGGSHKLKGSRRSVKYVVPAAVIVPADEVVICDHKGKAYKNFEVDSRPVTIPATKGRIMRHRPRWDTWQADFFLEIDETVLPATLIHQLLEEGGRRIGIGDFRPEKGGPFGRFEVLSWKESK